MGGILFVMYVAGQYNVFIINMNTNNSKYLTDIKEGLIQLLFSIYNSKDVAKMHTI